MEGVRTGVRTTIRGCVGGILKTEIIVPFGFLIVPHLKSPEILGGNCSGFVGPLFQRGTINLGFRVHAFEPFRVTFQMLNVGMEKFKVGGEGVRKVQNFPLKSGRFIMSWHIGRISGLPTAMFPTSAP